MPSGDPVIGRSGELETTAQNIAENGFAILPDVIDQYSTSMLVHELSSVKPAHRRAGLRHVHSHACVASLANDKELMNIASDVLGQGAFPFRATLFDKSPESNWLIGWHQDTALPLREKRDAEGWSSWSVKEGTHYAHAPSAALEQILALRVHLDDSTIENGPLRVVPGSHRSGVLNDDEITKIARRQDATVCLVNKGGIVAMRPLIIHASSKSHSPMPRRVLHIEYATTIELPGGLRLATAIPPSQTSAKPN